MLELHGTDLSQPCRAVSWLLRMKNIPFEYVMVMPGGRKEGGSKYDDFMKRMNPNGKVPVIRDGDFVLFESNAILQYLAEKYQLTDVWPSDIKQRAVVSQWMHWHHTQSREMTIGLFAPLMRPDLAKAFTPEFLAQKRAAIKGMMKVLEAQLAKTSFVAGQSVTLADLCIFQDVGQFSPTGHGLGAFDFTPYPNTLKWMQRMEKLPAYDESFELLDSIKARFQKATEASKIQSNL